MGEPILQSNLVYASENILNRRRRILLTARSLVAKHGYDGFSIRELCREARVAPQTVYKAFESKERLVALSIREHFTTFIANQRYKHEPHTLKGVVERLVVSDSHMSDHREFVVTIVALHFSSTADADLRDAARLHFLVTIEPWASALEKREELWPGIDACSFVNDVANLMFGVSLEWCRGRFSGARFIREKLRVLLVYTVGATTGATRKEAELLLRDVCDAGKAWTTIRSNGAATS